MTIAKGDTFPSVRLKRFGDDGLEDFNTGEAVKGKKIVLFGVPGAFTPTCQKNHLPGYLENADDIKSEGVDEIICVGVNDPFVMRAWEKEVGCSGKITLWADGCGELTRALGLELDGSGAGLGTRCKRFSMIIEDGKVTSLEIEDKASEVGVSGAEPCLAKLAA